MKALIRNKGETVTEDMKIPGIDWKNGMPLTNPVWAGGSYILVDDYVPPQDDGPTQYEEVLIEPDPVVDENDYVIIDGKRYSKAELRSLIE